MKMDLQTAKELLTQGGYTCVLCKGNAHIASKMRGVRPLLDWLDLGVDFSGFAAADKVVGSAAAFLYVMLGVRELYAPVMSVRAREILARYDIAHSCDLVVQTIRSRDHTGVCPLEQAAACADTPQEALSRIKEKLADRRRCDPND